MGKTPPNDALGDGVHEYIALSCHIHLCPNKETDGQRDRPIGKRLERGKMVKYVGMDVEYLVTSVQNWMNTISHIYRERHRNVYAAMCTRNHIYIYSMYVL